MEFLNSYRYSLWFPGKSWHNHSGEDSRRVLVQKRAPDGSPYRDTGIRITVYENRLEVDGVNYYGDGAWLQKLWELTERPGQPLPRGAPPR